MPFCWDAVVGIWCDALSLLRRPFEASRLQVNAEEQGVMQAQVEHKANEIKVRAANMVSVPHKSARILEPDYHYATLLVVRVKVRDYFV